MCCSGWKPVIICCAFAHQYESLDGKEHLEAGVDEERAEQAQAVISQVFEGHLEDVAPADAAQVDLLRGPIGSPTHSQELAEKQSESATVAGPGFPLLQHL